jgi:endonuclease III
MNELTSNRQQSDIATFITFANNLLERAMLGEAWHHRVKKFRDRFHSYDDVTEETVREVFDALKKDKHGYRWGEETATRVVMETKHVVMDLGFTWASYVQKAEEQYEDNFQADKFREIEGVGYKTRDLALSGLSDRFVAVDLHVVRVTSRIGLLLYGYGDPRITTAVNQESGYLFFHALILKMARRTGWPDAAGYSPGEIDRMLWHFGRAMCNDTPKCRECPIADICLTSVSSR